MLRTLLILLAALGSLARPAMAQTPARGSECLAMARATPRAVPVSLRRAAIKPDEVSITYAGHSTYYIETAGGVRIATDFNGVYQTGRLPDVVTMNRAHSTHYTLFPDPKIKHVLHGWGDDGKPALIHERFGDVLVRNVTTDIRRYVFDESNSEMVKDGNSIFIFEVAGLCIGHLGHLHHKLDESHFAQIGRLDIVMVPIDGSYTMSLDGVSEIVKRLRASVVSADAPLHDAARPVHAQDRPAIRHRGAQRTDADAVAERSAAHADGDHPAGGVRNDAAWLILNLREIRHGARRGADFVEQLQPVFAHGHVIVVDLDSRFYREERIHGTTKSRKSLHSAFKIFTFNHDDLHRR